MFNAMESVDNLIDEINYEAEMAEYLEFAEAAYDEILDELVYRVECGELTIEEAQLVSERAYDKYFVEAEEGKSNTGKKVAAGAAIAGAVAGGAMAAKKIYDAGKKDKQLKEQIRVARQDEEKLRDQAYQHAENMADKEEKSKKALDARKNAKSYDEIKSSAKRMTHYAHGAKEEHDRYNTTSQAANDAGQRADDLEGQRDEHGKKTTTRIARKIGRYDK